MDKPRDEFHSPEEIRDYIVRNYPELANGRGMSIGVLGGRYRVAVTDSQDITHTIKIDPKQIDAEREKLARTNSASPAAKTAGEKKLDRARRAAAEFFKRGEKGRTEDHDRER